MPTTPDRLAELDVLMDLWLAFGPGSLLWSRSSRESLCYEWLRYKAASEAPSYHDFSRILLEAERAREIRCAAWRMILKRVLAALRHRAIRRRPETTPPVPAPSSTALMPWRPSLALPGIEGLYLASLTDPS